MPKPTQVPLKPARKSPSRAAKPKSAARKTAAPTRKRKSPASGGVLSGTSYGRAAFSGWNRLSIDRKLDILGVLLALLGLLTLLSLVSSSNGAITGWWVIFVKRIAGWGAIALPLALVGIGVWLVLRNVESLPTLSTERLAGVILLYLNLLGWIHWTTGGGWQFAAQGLGGGYIGAFFEQLLVGALGVTGAAIALLAWTVIAIALTFDVSVTELFSFLQQSLASLARRAANSRAIQSHSRPASARHDLRNLSQPEEEDSAGNSQLPASFQPLPGVVTEESAAASAAKPRSVNRRGGVAKDNVAAPVAAADSTSQAAAAPMPQAPATPWKLPAISSILEAPTPEVLKSNQDAERGRLIEDTLQSFGYPVRVVETNRGPTVTQFGVEPLYVETRNGRTRVRVAKIVALSDDLALALAAPRIRIQAPVPGRNYVGIEVPNVEVSRVLLREVMESDAYRKLKSPMRFALGKDVSGHAKAYDLAGMPHLLIAGTTGSGKSVLVNAILCSLLLNNTPAELRLMLVDPKRVELTGYNGIPHLLAPVIVEAEEVVGALQWVQREMDARYHRFSQVGARNIVDYNARSSPPLPYMLVLIDELADLMMLAPEETERSLTRLAQLARATGIHLVLATQRPSVNVVTGLIKANFPARVAFAVASNTDSRVILDQPGAERLLGRGDMLFQAPDAAAPARIQGVWVSDPEIQRLIDYWRTQAYDLRTQNTKSTTATPVDLDLPPHVPLKQAPLWETGDEKSGDPLLEDAINIVRQEGKMSISLLQRKMRIGYTRAARLIDVMEEKGIAEEIKATAQAGESGENPGQEKDITIDQSI